MEKIGFIGTFDKTDFIIYVARILVELDKKILIIDSTSNQKAKYIVPSISPTKSYVTEYEGIDIAVGFTNYSDIKKYLGMPEMAAFTYDYIFIDMDNPQLINSFDIYTFAKNYFVTSPDLYDLKKGLEILSGINRPLELTKIWFSRKMTKEEDDYLNFLSLGYKIKWKKEKGYIALYEDDRDVIIDNQRLSKIKFKGLSPEFKDSMADVVSEISGEDVNLIKKAIKQLERGA